jgi:effector-binding domain-containing protein
MSAERPGVAPDPGGGDPSRGQPAPGGGDPSRRELSGEPAPGGEPAVAIVELEPVRVATVRAIVAPDDLPAFMADALGMVVIALDQGGVRPAGPPFARYFAMSADGLDVAAGFPVAEPFLGAGVVHPGELPAGPAAVTTHVGGFDGLEAAWQALRRRIGELGRRRGQDPWEVYFVGPGSGVDESAWRTELVWPLEPEDALEPATTGEPAAPAPGEPGAEPSA